MPKEEKRKFTRRQKIGLVLLVLACTTGLASGIYFACKPGYSHPKSKHGKTTDPSLPTPLDSDVKEEELLPNEDLLPPLLVQLSLPLISSLTNWAGLPLLVKVIQARM